MQGVSYKNVLGLIDQSKEGEGMKAIALMGGQQSIMLQVAN
jgi:hypothetical protein